MAEPAKLEIPRLVIAPTSADMLDELGQHCAAGRATLELRAADGTVIGHSGSWAGRQFVRVDRVAAYLFDARSPVEAIPEQAVAREAVVDIYHRMALPLVLQARGTQILHASAVDSPAGLLVICGASGAGKSTLAFGLEKRGYSQWADDVVAFSASRKRVIASPLPFEVRLLPDTAAHFAVVPDPAGGSPEPPRKRHRKPRPVVLGLLLQTQRTADGQIDLSRASPGEPLLSELLGHAFCFDLGDPAAKRSLVKEYLRLATAVPFYRVVVSGGTRHLDAHLDAIERLLTAAPV